MEALEDVIKEILKEDIIKIVISNKVNKDVTYNKINITLKEKNNNEYYQMEKFTDKQVFHENIDKSQLESKLIESIENKYKQVSAWSETTTFDLKISKKGKIHLSKRKSDNVKMVNKSHNKEKIISLKKE